MPLALNRDAWFKVWLESDEDIEEENRPHFVSRYLADNSYRQMVGIEERVEQVGDDLGAILSEMEDVLCLAVVDWRNMTDPLTHKEIKFSREAVGEVLNPSEVWELIYKILAQNRLKVDAQKKFESPSPIRTGKSAKGARARKRAKTSRRKGSPS